MSGSNCCFLTCTHISKEAGQVVWYSRLFQNFPQFIVIHTVKGFGIVNEAEVNVFLELSCFFDDPTDVGNLIPGSSGLSKPRLEIWDFMAHELLKPILKNFEHYFGSVWDECSCVVVWTFFGLLFLWDWNENWPFPVLWPLLSFPNLLAYWMQHFNSIIFFRIWNSSTGIPSPPLALFLVMLPKDHLTLHSRMSVFRWVITPWWLSGSWSSFLYSSVCFCHFFLISSASVRSIPFLSFFVSIFARKSTWSHGGVTDVKIERKRTEIGILSYHCLAYILQCGVYYTFLCTN